MAESHVSEGLILDDGILLNDCNDYEELFLDSSIIKEEPTEIYEGVSTNAEQATYDKAAKDQLENRLISEDENPFSSHVDSNIGDEDEPIYSSSQSDSISTAASSSNFIGNAQFDKHKSVTKKLIINGQEKTCVLVKMPQLDMRILNNVANSCENIIRTNSDTSVKKTLKVQCPRCKSTVAMENFRQHIDACPPRKPGNRKFNENCDRLEKEANKSRGPSIAPSVDRALTYDEDETERITKIHSCSNSSKSSPLAYIRISKTNNRDGTLLRNEISETFGDDVQQHTESNKRSPNSSKTLNSEGGTILINYWENWETLQTTGDIVGLNEANVEEQAHVPESLNEASIEPQLPIPESANEVTVKPQALVSEANGEKTLFSPRKTTSKSLLALCRRLSSDSNLSNLDFSTNKKDVGFKTVEPQRRFSDTSNENVSSPRIIRSRSLTVLCRRLSGGSDLSSFDFNISKEDSGCKILSKSSINRSNREKDSMVNSGDFVSAGNSNNDKDDNSNEKSTKNKGQTSSEFQNEDNSKPAAEKQDNTHHGGQNADCQKILQVRIESASKKLDLNSKLIFSNNSSTGISVGSVGNKEISASCAISVNDGKSFTVTQNESEEAQESAETLGNSSLLDDSTFSCSICSFTTYRQRILNDHERNHRQFGKPIFKCVYCNQRYTKYALHSHIQNVHPGQKFRVDEEVRPEEKSAKTPKRIQQLGLKLYRCRQCFFNTRTRQLLTVHMKKHLVKESTERERAHAKEKAVERTEAGNDMRRFEPIRTEESKECESENAAAFKNTINLEQNKAESAKNSYKRKDVNAQGKSIEPESMEAFKDKAPKKSSKRETKPTESDNNEAVKVTTNLESKTRENPKHKNDSEPKMYRCKHCMFSTRTQIMFAGHMRIHSVKKLNKMKRITRGTPVESNIYKCRQCPFTTRTEIDLIEHMKTHSVKDPELTYLKKHQKDHEKFTRKVKCRWCDFKSTLPALKFHQKTCAQKHKHSSVKCKLCSYTCKFKGWLKRHEVSHEGGAPILNCTNTGCTYRSTSAILKRHMENWCNLNRHPTRKKTSIDQHHKLNKESKCIRENKKKENVNPEARFKCRKCSYVSAFIGNLKGHVKLHKRYKTLRCKCGFKSLDRCFPRHVRACNVARRKDKDVTSNTDEDSYKDSNCATKNEEKENKIPGKKNDEGVSLLCCSKCTFSTDIQSELDTHIKKPHVNLFKCKFCSVVATSSYIYNRHMISHEKNYPIRQCFYCHFKSTNSCVYRHIKDVHKGKSVMCRRPGRVQKNVIDNNKPNPDENTSRNHREIFKCKYCSYVATRRNYLKMHMVSHKNKGDVKKCPHCSFVSTKNYLLQHMKKHTKNNGLKSLNRFKCGKCSFVGMKCALVRHMSAHKNNQPVIKCPECNFRSTPVHLSKHIDKTHKVVTNQSLNKNEKDLDELEAAAIKNLQDSNAANRPGQDSDSREKDRLFNCKLCSARDMSDRGFKAHMKSHDRGLPIRQCLQCDFRSTRSYLQVHVHKFGHQGVKWLDLQKKRKSVSSAKVVKCRLCPAVLFTRGHLLTHLKSHKNSPIKKCSVCDFKSTNSYLAKHIRETQHHANVCNRTPRKKIPSDSNSIGKNLGRPKATEVTSDEEADVKSKKLSSNVEVQESSNFQCPLCEFSTSLRIKLNMHKRKMHPELNDEEEIVKPNILKVIPKALEVKKPSEFRNETLKKCNRNHNSESVPSSSSNFRTNVKEKNKITYSCDVCSYKSSIPSNFKKHVSAHKIDKPPIFKCQSCDFKGTADMISMHPKNCGSTTSPKKSRQKVPLNCVKCSFATYKSAALKNHEKIAHIETKLVKHIGQLKIFKCDFCSFSSYWKNLITRHMYFHTLKLPIEQCPKCDFRSTPVALAAHTNNCIKNNLR